MSNDKQIKSRIIETKPIKWKDLQFLQSDKFKDLSPVDEEKLINSLIVNDFADAFSIWLDASDNTLYCLDGKHRSMCLYKLIERGYNVPDELPGTFIQCENKQQAAKITLLYTANYARLNQIGFLDFVESYGLNIDDIKLQMDFPDFAFPVFDTEVPTPEELIAELKEKPPTMKITFVNVQQLENAKSDIDKLIEEKYPNAFYSVSCGEI